MRRLLVGLGLVFGLGCAGLGESLVEMTTGGEVQITEDGMIMKMEDGSEVVVASGDHVEVPADYPLPPPREGARPSAITTLTSPDGERSVMVSYTLEVPKDEAIATYRAWFEAQGVTPQHTTADELGTHTEVLSGALPDGRHAAVSLTQAFGQDALTLSVGKDLEALEEL